MLDIIKTLTVCVILLAAVLRSTSLLPEPTWPIKTPFGKLPFFDGVLLYGIIIYVLLVLAGLVLLS